MQFDTLVSKEQLDSIFTNITNAIREKTGDTGPIDVQDCADRILSISNNGPLKLIVEATFEVPTTQTNGTQSYRINGDIVNALYNDCMASFRPYCYIYTITPLEDVQLTASAYYGTCEQFLVTNAVRNQINIQYTSGFHKFVTNDNLQYEKENSGVVFGNSFSNQSQSINTLTTSVIAKPYLNTIPLIKGTYKISIYRLAF